MVMMVLLIVTAVQAVVMCCDNPCMLEPSGCTSSWADNYDPQATIDDGSCERLGCMSEWADNYDSLATTDNISIRLYV